jgi:ABC-type transporter Mla MlaB component
VIVLKISISESGNAVALQLEGKLIGPWVEELRRLSDLALSEDKSLIIDLEKVQFADARGVALLQELAGRQVSQVNCSQFLTQQLKETAL